MDVGGIELGFFDVIWIFFILAFMIPLFRRKLLEVSRASLIRKIERKRKSRLITLIHRQEGMSLLGIPVANYINIEDSEQIMRAIRFTPEDQLSTSYSTPPEASFLRRPRSRSR